MVFDRLRRTRIRECTLERGSIWALQQDVNPERDTSIWNNWNNE
jgi:hypothetical protein